MWARDVTAYWALEGHLLRTAVLCVKWQDAVDVGSRFQRGRGKGGKDRVLPPLFCVTLKIVPSRKEDISLQCENVKRYSSCPGVCEDHEHVKGDLVSSTSQHEILARESSTEQGLILKHC
ncbi:UNVERIFIED_CONTAM: hypothetical protein K2H54_018730 [Gekko kuhli]